MKIPFKRIIILIIFSSIAQLKSVSVVYNLQIAAVTTPEIKSTGNSTTALILFDQTRTRTTSIFLDNTVGSMVQYNFTKKNFYFRANTAFGNVRTRKCHETIFARTQTDDILLTWGYIKTISRRAKLTTSVLLGFPTHKDTTLEGITFGLGHNSFGLQLDGFCKFSEKENQVVFGAARFIRFFPATVTTCIENKSMNYDLDIGKLTDLLIGYTYVHKSNIFEVGYNPSFLFSAKINPDILGLQLNAIRSSFFGAYERYLYAETKHPQALIFALSYGFDNKPKIFKRIITAWAVWGISF
jgi:hypothetical protein